MRTKSAIVHESRRHRPRPSESEITGLAELEFAPQRTDIKAPHFVMYVKDLLVQKYGQQMVEEGGLEVTTSLDLNLQEKTQQLVEQEIIKLYPLNVTNGAALVTVPATGEILSMVGSIDYFNLENDGNVNVTLAQRQPGSSIGATGNRHLIPGSCCVRSGRSAGCVWRRVWSRAITPERGPT